MNIENLNQLTINTLTKEQFEKAVAENKINENEIYLTPKDDILIDQEYDASSKNAQSGTAVAEALEEYVPLTNGVNIQTNQLTVGSDDMVIIEGNQIHFTSETYYEGTFSPEGVSFTDNDECTTAISTTGLSLENDSLNIQSREYLGEPATVTGSNSMKQAWKDFLDIDDYLPLSGGTMEGEIKFEETDSHSQTSTTINDTITSTKIYTDDEGNDVGGENKAILDAEELSLSDEATKSSLTSSSLDFYYDDPGEHTNSRPVFSISYTGVTCNDESIKQSWRNFLEIDSSVTIDPIFANNSWETIAWVAKNDDPSKYWSVGDYKMLDFPGFTRGDYLTYRQYGNSIATTYTWSLPKLTRTDNGASGAYSQGTVEIVDIPKFISKITSFDVDTLFNTTRDKYNAIECQLTCNGEADGTSDKKRILFQIRPVKSDNGKTTIVGSFKIADRITTSEEKSAIEKLLENYGIEIKLNDDYDNLGYRTRGAYLTVCLGQETIPARQYPVMWVDSHKDRVLSPAEYGKSKAGLTLCLGVTRSCVEACPPYNYTDALKNNIYDLCFFLDAQSDTQQQMPYISDDGKRVLSPYTYCDSTPIGENEYTIQTQTWGETQFRKVLQQLLDSTELADMIVPVKKMTAYKLFRPNFNYLPAEETADKVFLPSEHELNGQRFYYTGSYLNKDTEPSSSITCGIGEEGETYEFFKQGASRFFWNEEFLNDYSVKEVNLFTRSKPRQSTDKAIERSSECCYLKCKGNTFKNGGLQYTSKAGLLDSFGNDDGKYRVISSNTKLVNIGSIELDCGKFTSHFGQDHPKFYELILKYEEDGCGFYLKEENGDTEPLIVGVDEVWDDWNGAEPGEVLFDFGFICQEMGSNPWNSSLIGTEVVVFKFAIGDAEVESSTTLTVDSDLTNFIEDLKYRCSDLDIDFKEPIGVYNFVIEGDSTEENEGTGQAQIQIYKDGETLEVGDGIISYPVFHLDNITPGFEIEGTLKVTGSVSYEPSAGNVEGYILPMFCI